MSPLACQTVSVHTKMNSDCLLFCRIFELVLPKYAAHSLEKYFGYRLRQIQRPGSITTREALSWINQIDNQPFFVLVHYFDVHGPHVKPSEKRLHVPPSLMWIRKLALKNARRHLPMRLRHMMNRSVTRIVKSEILSLN